ncbi:MAG: hypothetical protein AAGI07_18665 [Bacteroidota bacterium]
MQGAGGTDGGIGRFFLGLIMLIGGGYLFLNSVHVHNNFGLGYRLFSVGGMGITSGFVLIPFIIGTGMVFFNSKNYIGWLLMIGSIIMLVFGIITSLQFTMRHMSLFELLSILILTVGGLGLFLSSLRSLSG